MIKTLIRSVVLFGSETWTADIKRLEAIETWTWRRTETVGWTEHNTSEEVLETIANSYAQ